ncbi:MAG: YfiT family bacillithiol transferase [Bacteroidota bacterium]
MTENELQALRYPIGYFSRPDTITDEIIKDWIAQLESYPSRLRALVSTLTEEQLGTPYRPDGWTVRQVIHHVSDSHHNSYVRFKWGLTEDRPTIKAYEEKHWAELFDTKTGPIELSLVHLEAVHAKLVYLLKGLSREQLRRVFIHPDDGNETSLEENIGRYVWHGNHHFAHINNLLERKGWLN